MSDEHQNGRKAMDQLIKGMIQSGVPVQKAKEKAREVALRHDRNRKNPKKNK